jgi:uncharacterized damage-inducible protein DinB
MAQQENPLVDVIQHSSWATVTLLGFCHRLSPEQLELSTPGTYGSVVATLEHLLRAEQAYLARLMGVEPSNSSSAGSRPDIDELTARGQALAVRWAELLRSGLDGQRRVRTIRGEQTVGVLIAQVLSHSCEHRAQVCTVLGAHGIAPPAIDAFAYGQQRLAGASNA